MPDLPDSAVTTGDYSLEVYGDNLDVSGGSLDFGDVDEDPFDPSGVTSTSEVRESRWSEYRRRVEGLIEPPPVRTFDISGSSLPLKLAAFAPSTAARGSRIVVRAAAFTEDFEASVEQAARELSADPFGAMSFAKTTAVVEPRRHLLTAVIMVGPAGARLLSDVVQARYLPLDISRQVDVGFDYIIEVEREAEISTLDCEITLYLGPLMLAVLQPSVVISDQRSPEIEALTGGIDRVFASYSRRDGEIVDAIEVAARALGVNMFVDRLSLRSGESWRREIAQQIQQVDAFQLFWSKAAAESSAVSWEWWMALTRLESGEVPISTRFIRPVRWESDAPPLPRELEHFHMPFLPELVSS